MHPGDQPNAVLGRVGFQAHLANGFRSGQDGLKDDVDRNVLCMGKPLYDLLRMFGDFLKRLRTVQMLASRDEPYLELFEVDHHSFLSLLPLLEQSALRRRTKHRQERDRAESAGPGYCWP